MPHAPFLEYMIRNEKNISNEAMRRWEEWTPKHGFWWWRTCTLVQKTYCYTPGVSICVDVCVSVRMQNVRANVKVFEFQSSCILTLLIILIKPLTTKAYHRRIYLATLAPLVKNLTLAITAKLDLDNISHNSCPWPKGVSWPRVRPKIILKVKVTVNTYLKIDVLAITPHCQVGSD